jgi:molybdopterin-guanine dinucleotide biosynthesis protein A
MPYDNVSHAQFSAALIAGGRSSRMGRDKAFLPWRGMRLLDHQLGTLRALGPAELLISGRGATDYEVGDARVVVDATPDLGPLGGLAALLAAARTPRVLVLAIDLPAITSEFLERLVAHECGAVPRFGSAWEPLAALYPVSLRAEAETRLASSDLSLRGFIEAGVRSRALTPYPLSGPEHRLFANLNTPEEYRGGCGRAALNAQLRGEIPNVKEARTTHFENPNFRSNSDQGTGNREGRE